MTPNQKHILETVAKFYGVSKTRILSIEKTKQASRARQVLCLMLHESNYSYPQIGIFIKKDHSTCIHAVKNIHKLMDGSKTFADEILTLRDMIAGDEQIIARDAWHNRYYKPPEPDPFDFKGMDIVERDILLDVTKPKRHS